MPKQLKEIRNFNSGITSNASPTDINDESASYSLNINSNNILGRLQGIKSDKLFTNDGFKILEDVSASSIQIDFSNIFSTYYTGNVQDAATGFGLARGFSIDNLSISGELFDEGVSPGNPATINNATMFWTVDSSNPESYFIPSSARVYSFFDDNGTLQYLPLVSAAGPNPRLGMILNDIPAFPIRATGASVGFTQGGASKPVFGWNKTASDLDLIKTFLYPSNAIVQIHLDGTEWIFKINDTDASGLNPTPYTCDMNYLNPMSMTGELYGSTGWDVNVVTVDVDLNSNRTYASTEGESNSLSQFRNQIKNTIEDSGKGTVVIENGNMTITPSNIVGYNFCRTLSTTGGSSIIVTQDIVNGPIIFTSSNFKSIPDKDDKSKTDIININNNIIEYYKDVFSHSIQQAGEQLLTNFNYTTTDMQSDSDKIYIGAGGNEDTPPKIAIKTKGNPLLDNSDNSKMRIEDFNLNTFTEVSEFSASSNEIGNVVLFPIHGTHQCQAGEETLYGDGNVFSHSESWADDGKVSYLETKPEYYQQQVS